MTCWVRWGCFRWPYILISTRYKWWSTSCIDVLTILIFIEYTILIFRFLTVASILCSSSVSWYIANSYEIIIIIMNLNMFILLLLPQRWSLIRWSINTIISRTSSWTRCQFKQISFCFWANRIGSSCKLLTMIGPYHFFK